MRGKLYSLNVYIYYYYFRSSLHYCHGVRGCQERGTSFKHFNSNTEQRSLETGTHTQGMTLRLDTEAGKQRAYKETNE